MNRYEKQTQDLLGRIGATLSRRKNHEVWHLPNGSMYVRSCTPSSQNASRKQWSELKRRFSRENGIAGSVEPAPSVPMAQSTKRLPHCARAARSEDPGLLYLNLGRSDGPPEQPAQVRKEFANVDELISTLMGIDAFWDLDGCAKTRVFARLSEAFATVQKVAVTFNRFGVIAAWKPDLTQQDEAYLASHTWADIWMDHARLWQGYARCAIYLKFKGGAPSLLVDFQAPTQCGYREQVNVISNAFDSEGTLVTTWPMWSNKESKPDTGEATPEHVMTYCFANKKGMSKWGISIQYRRSYSDPRAIRPVLKQIDNVTKMESRAGGPVIS